MFVLPKEENMEELLAAGWKNEELLPALKEAPNPPALLQNKEHFHIKPFFNLKISL